MNSLEKNIYHNSEAIEIEHWNNYDHVKWNNISGNYFAPKGEGGEFGHTKHSFSIKPNTKIFKYRSSIDFLSDIGIAKKYNKRLKDKYEKECKSIDQECKIESYWDLYDWSYILNNPNVCYLESQLTAIKTIRKNFNPQVIHFTYEDELNPTQYVVLDPSCLEKEENNISKMKHLHTFENYRNFDYVKELNNHFWEDESDYPYLYHFTLTDNIDSITDEGLIPRKYPNSHYPNGCQGVFLTTKEDTYSANLPQEMIDLLEDYYEEISDDGEDYDPSESPLTIMRIRVDNLDPSKFRPDDDYVRDIFNNNKAKTLEEQVIESLKEWGAVCYVGDISVDNIIDYFPVL